jgi:hypothetical protein
VLDHPLHGLTSTAMGAGARRSVVFTTLLGVVEGNNAGSRKLPRQFWLGLALPNIVDVSRRGRAGMVADFHGAGWAAGPSPFLARHSGGRKVLVLREQTDVPIS